MTHPIDYVFPGKLVPVTAVEVIGEYRLRLTFKDGIVGDVSFTDREWNGVFAVRESYPARQWSEALAAFLHDRDPLGQEWARDGIDSCYAPS
jgi:hypothetical protein